MTLDRGLVLAVWAFAVSGVIAGAIFFLALKGYRFDPRFFSGDWFSVWPALSAVVGTALLFAISALRWRNRPWRHLWGWWIVALLPMAPSILIVVSPASPATAYDARLS